MIRFLSLYFLYHVNNLFYLYDDQNGFLFANKINVQMIVVFFCKCVKNL